jgi:D-proline reductase (dithiol) PrdB
LTSSDLTTRHTEPHRSHAIGANFAEIEQEFVCDRINPDFCWRPFDDFSPFNPLSVPLESARVAFVTTCGAHLESDRPFDLKSAAGDPSFREFPSTVQYEDLALTHRGYDTRRAKEDVNVVLPLDHLRAASADGRIGEIAPNVLSFMGFIADTDPLLNEIAPAVARRLLDDEVDLVLLAPT